jgi:hypothetical protein
VAEYPELGEKFKGKRYGTYAILKPMTNMPTKFGGFIKKVCYPGRTSHGCRDLSNYPNRFGDHNCADERVNFKFNY